MRKNHTDIPSQLITARIYNKMFLVGFALVVSKERSLVWHSYKLPLIISYQYRWLEDPNL